MWTPKISERELFVLSLTSITLLLLASDLAPPEISGFKGIQEDGEEVLVVCALLDMKRTEEGWILTLMDVESITAKGFCPEDLMPAQFPDGTLLEITATASLDPEPFLFIESISACASSEGKI